MLTRDYITDYTTIWTVTVRTDGVNPQFTLIPHHRTQHELT